MSEKRAKEERKEADVILKEAKEALKKEQDRKVKACQEEISTSLSKHNCIIDAFVTVTAKGNIPRISILPKEDN